MNLVSTIMLQMLMLITEWPLQILIDLAKLLIDIAKDPFAIGIN